MSIPIYKALRAANVPDDVAQEAADSIAENSSLATKTDLEKLRANLYARALILTLAITTIHLTGLAIAVAYIVSRLPPP